MEIFSSFFQTLSKKPVINSLLIIGYHDRIHHLICHLPAQLLLHGRRSAFLHDLGNGKLWRSIFTTASLFLSGYSDRAADYHTLDKPLNALLLGTRYAENLGINIRRTRNLLLIATGILTAITTAFCGPISFIGLAVPHIARLMLGTSNHNSLLPVTMLTGGVIALVVTLSVFCPGEACDFA